MRCAPRICLAAGLLACAGATRAQERADEPRVVENPDHGVWDDEPRRNFHLLESLVLGSGDGDDAFERIAGMAVDSRGRWIILDSGLAAVRVYDPDALTMRSIGRKGAEPGEFDDPLAIGLDSADRIFVASQGGRVVVFSPNGELVAEFRHKFPGGGPVVNVEAGAAGIYLASLDPFEHKIIHRYDLSYAYRGSFADSHAAVKAMDMSEEFATCGGTIDLGPDGSVYFAQFTPYEIRKFSADGRHILTIRRANDFMRPPRIERTRDSFSIQSFAQSAGIFVLPDGKLMHLVVLFPESETESARTVIDIFDRDGRLLKSRVFGGRILVRVVDDRWYAYASEERDYPIVVRYDFRLP